ncbi:MAG: ATP-binding protein [Chloroflexota bacterium]
MIVNAVHHKSKLRRRSHILRQAGYEVLEARTGPDALALVARAHPALLVLDTRLPDFSPVDLCRQLKSNPATQTTFILQTSAANEAHGDQAADGADHLLREPVKASDLIAAIHLLLRLREAQHALRARTPQSMADGDNLLETIVNSMTDGIYAKNLQGRYVLVNPAGAAYVGSTVAEMLGKEFAAILPPDEARAVMEEDRQVIATGEPQPIENTRMTPNGWRTFQSIKTPYRDAAGAIIGVVAISRDISERKRADQEREQLMQQLLAERTRLETIIQQIPSALAVVEAPSGKVILANAQRDQVLRMETPTIDGVEQYNVIEGFHPNGRTYRPEEWPLARSLLTGEVVIGEEINVVFGDGARGAIRVNSTPIRDETGRITSGIVIFDDISDHKRLVEARNHLLLREHAARAAAEKAQRRSAALAEVSALLVASLDFDATLKIVARVVIPSFADYCAVWMLDGDRTRQVAEAHCDPQHEEWLRELAQRYAPPVQNPMSPQEQLLRSGETVVIPEMPASLSDSLSVDPEVRRIWRDLGTQSLVIAPLMVQGQALGAMTFAMSLSGRRYDEADREFAQEIARRAALAIDNARLYQKAEAAVRIRDQFLSVASHELKTPLTALVGYADLLQQRAAEGRFAERDQRAIRVIAQQIARLEKMIGSLFDLSRLEKGQFDIEGAPVELNDLAQQVALQINPTLKRHTLAVRTASAPVVIFGDEAHLQQALQNLIQNAIKYSPLGGPIDVQVERAGMVATIAVTDHGIGIPAAALPQLFDRFYRASNAEAWHINGMGIGLYIVKEIVRLHGGEVKIESEEGSGSTFTICLPLASNETSAPGNEGEASIQNAAASVAV